MPSGQEKEREDWPVLLILSFDRRAFSFVTDAEREQALKHNDPAHLETYVPEADAFNRFREALLSEAEKLERPKLGEDFYSATVRKVKVQGIRDALASIDPSEGQRR